MFLGEFDLETMKQNIREAIKVYIQRVDNTPLMGTTIKLYPGIEDSSFHRRRESLLVYLKGSQAKKAALKKARPEWFAHFDRIWNLRNAHMVSSSIPSKYAFILKCCGSKDCIHPSCTGQPIDIQWFEGGPSIGEISPTPVIDSRFDVNVLCTSCSKRDCAGHYKSTIPERNDKHAPVPSVLLSNEVQSSAKFDMKRIQKLGKQCILPPKTVQFYVNHLLKVKRNRKRGVEKARKTRLAKSKEA